MVNGTTSPLVTKAAQQLTGQVRLGVDIFAIIFGAFGNGLVMAVIVRKRERNINDRFILNLAIADVLFVIFCIPGDVYRAIGKSANSQFFCSFVRPLVTMFFCLGLFTITSMALYRCKVMLNPYKAKMKAVYANLWILVTWILSFVTALPAIIVATVTKTGSCTGTWKSPEYKDAYIIFLLIAKCVLPLFLIIVSYGRIGVYLYKNKVPKATANQSQGELNYRNRAENIKVIKTVAAIVILFALCTTPHQAAWIMTQFGNRAQQRKAISIFRVSSIIQNLHTCMNPLIYAISRKYFRQDYIKYLNKIFCCCCAKLQCNTAVEGSLYDDVTQQARDSAHARDEGYRLGHVTAPNCLTEGLNPERTTATYLSPLFGRKISTVSPEIGKVTTN